MSTSAVAFSCEWGRPLEISTAAPRIAGFIRQPPSKGAATDLARHPARAAPLKQERQCRWQAQGRSRRLDGRGVGRAITALRESSARASEASGGSCWLTGAATSAKHTAWVSSVRTDSTDLHRVVDGRKVGASALVAGRLQAAHPQLGRARQAQGTSDESTVKPDGSHLRRRLPANSPAFREESGDDSVHARLVG